MINVPLVKKNEISESDVIYRCIGESLKNGIVACGFMKKETAERSQYDFSNEFYSCFILLEGSGDYITENGEVIELKEGDLVQRIPGKRHSTRVEGDGKWLEFFISVGADFFYAQKSLGILSEEPVKKDAVRSVDTDHMRSLINRLKNTSLNELPVMSLELQQEILHLWGYGSKIEQDSGNDDFLRNACDLLTQNLNMEISYEGIANKLQMSYESFRKKFKQEYGLSPNKFRIEKKMEQACMLLDSGIPIKEIARMVGYEDVYSFGKQFSKSYGLSPGKYRNKEAE